MHTCLHTHLCTHLTHSTHAHTLTPHTFMHVHTYSGQHNSAKKKACPCVCASPPASSSVSGSLFTPPLGSWKDVKGVISSRETSERLKRVWGAISPVSHATLEFLKLDFKRPKKAKQKLSHLKLHIHKKAYVFIKYTHTYIYHYWALNNRKNLEMAETR